MRKLLFLFFVLLHTNRLMAQDPHFSQFYAAPLFMSPAQTLNTDADMRFMSAVRSQWINPAAPYITGMVSMEGRLLKKKIEKNVLAYGLSFLHDYTFDGILKSNYAQANLAYHVYLDKDNHNKISLGYGAMYGKKYLDFSRLIFAEQFTSGGFNTSLPSGELLSNMKPFLSMSTGLAFSRAVDNARFDIGGSLFHFNGPKQTFLKDESQLIPRRWVANASLDLLRANDDIVNFCAVFQQQANLNYWLTGVNYGFSLSSAGKSGYGQTGANLTYLNIGAFYRLHDAIVPYISLYHNDFQFGFSYDQTLSKLALARPRAKTFEFTMSYRFKRDDDDASNSVQCPFSPWR